MVAILAQVKKLLKLYSLRKYSCLLKCGLELQNSNISLNFLSEVFYFPKGQLERNSATVLQSRLVFPFSEITGIQKLGPQEKQTVGIEEKDLKGIEGTLCDIALKKQPSRILLSILEF